MKNSAGTILACLTIALSAPAPARAGDELPDWGKAIAARVVGERCPGTLDQGDIAALSGFIAADFQRSIEGSSHGPAWWADLRDKLEASYAEKYADPANCTGEARDEAEDTAEAVREHGN